MSSYPCERRLIATWFMIGPMVLCSTVVAQRDSAEYKVGDKVEVENGSEWMSGTVVKLVGRGGRIEVRVDDPDFPKSMPADIRERFSTRPYPPDRVRPAKASAAKKGAAKAKAQKPADTPTTSEKPIRKWSDRTGKFSVDARFYHLKGDRVALVKTDGKLIEVPLAKLSEEDAKYVRELTDPIDENPFTNVPAAIATADDGSPEGSEPTESTESAAAPSAPTNGAKKANWRQVKAVRPQKFAKWSFKPSGGEVKAPAADAANVEVELQDIPGSDKFFEKVLGVYVAQDGSRAIVARQKGAVSHNEPQFLELVDAGYGKSQGLVKMPAKTVMLDVSPADGLVMFRSEGQGFGNENVLTIAKLEGDQLTTVKQWTPYDHEDWEPNRDITNAWFLGAGRVMTMNRSGQALTVWDVDATKALTNIPVGRGMQLQIALSPDRKLLAIVMKEGIAIIDLNVGQHVATIPTEGERLTRLAIRGDNSRLAALSNDGASVWDLATGEKVQDMFNTAVHWGSDLNWAGDFLLVGNQHLFDVGRRILLWEYQGAPHSDKSAAMQGGRLWVVPDLKRERAAVLTSSPMPHVGAIEEAQKLPPGDALLCVKPGDAVAIEVDIDPGVVLTDDIQKVLAAKIQAKGQDGGDGKVVMLNPGRAQGDVIRELLAVGLEAAGLKVVDKADLVVKAVCKPQPQQTIKINTDNRWPRRAEDIVERTITPHASFLEMTLKGEILWKRGYVAQPHMTIWLEEGESLDQALERLTKPNLTIFTHAKFSGHVARPGKATANGAYEVSQFTTSGIIDGQSADGRGGVFE
jgi:hypothetical protein